MLLREPAELIHFDAILYIYTFRSDPIFNFEPISLWHWEPIFFKLAVGVQLQCSTLFYEFIVF